MTDRIMIDIETLGREPGCAIIAIGAARFDAREVGETFEVGVDLDSNGTHGLSVEHETLAWWLTQGPQAREQLVGGESLQDALDGLGAFIGDADEIWANSASFDCRILEAAYSAIGREKPWAYYEERDYRTLKELGISHEIEQEGIEHDAVDDAVHQATIAATVLGRINEEGNDE